VVDSLPAFPKRSYLPTRYEIKTWWLTSKICSSCLWRRSSSTCSALRMVASSENLSYSQTSGHPEKLRVGYLCANSARGDPTLNIRSWTSRMLGHISIGIFSSLFDARTWFIVCTVRINGEHTTTSGLKFNHTFAACWIPLGVNEGSRSE